MDIELNITHNIDCKQGIKNLPKESINCSVSSPPYWSLRDYDVKGQFGQEDTPLKFIENLVSVYDEIYRVLRSDGVCFVNLGDTYNGAKVGNTETNKNKKLVTDSFKKNKIKNIQDKSLLMIPYRFAWAMVEHGWILRNIINWTKPNQMPSSVKDRFTVDFEPIFMFVKSKKYYFEQQLESVSESSIKRAKYGWKGKLMKNGSASGGMQHIEKMGTRFINTKGRNMRTTWEINTKSFSQAHFAVYPEKLVERMIKSGCPENGIVLDAFHGSGTTGIVARKLNRNFIGYELNPNYVKLSEKRYADELGLFI